MQSLKNLWRRNYGRRNVYEVFIGLRFRIHLSGISSFGHDLGGHYGIKHTSNSRKR